MIGGQLHTKPPEPRLITKEEVQGWMDEMVAKKAADAQGRTNAEASKATTVAQIDGTIDKFTGDEADDDANIVTLQEWLDTFE